MILDACRDNERELELRRQEAAARGDTKRGGSVSRGLARLQNPDGLIVVYSTQHLTTAADGVPGGNSPFTGTLARHLVTPGVDIKDVLFRTASEVVKQVWRNATSGDCDLAVRAVRAGAVMSFNSLSHAVNLAPKI